MTATPTDGRQSLFEPVARAYSAVFPLVWRYLTPGLHSWMADRLADRERILDAGTGSGYWLRMLGQRREREQLVGLDTSPAFLEIAKRKFPAGRYLLADMAESGCPDAQFDAVVCAGVLDTLPDADAALREFFRLSSPGGLVALVLRGGNKAVSSALETVFRWVVGALRAIRERDPRRALVSTGQWVREPLLPRLPALARSAGLEVVEVDQGLLASRVLLRRPFEPCPGAKEE